MGTDDSYIRGECSILYRLVQSQCYIPETKVTLCSNYIQIKQLKNMPYEIVIDDQFTVNVTCVKYSTIFILSEVW